MSNPAICMLTSSGILVWFFNFCTSRYCATWVVPCERNYSLRINLTFFVLLKSCYMFNYRHKELCEVPKIRSQWLMNKTHHFTCRCFVMVDVNLYFYFFIFLGCCIGLLISVMVVNEIIISVGWFYEMSVWQEFRETRRKQSTNVMLSLLSITDTCINGATSPSSVMTVFSQQWYMY